MASPKIGMQLLELLDRLHGGELGLSWKDLGLTSALVDRWRRRLCVAGGEPIEIEASTLVQLCEELRVPASRLPIDEPSQVIIAAQLLNCEIQFDGQNSPINLLKRSEAPASHAPSDVVRHLACRLDCDARETASTPRSMAQCLAFSETLGDSHSDAERKLEEWMKRTVHRSHELMGCCVAFESGKFFGKSDFAMYVHRAVKPPIVRRTDFPEKYVPHYREWDWYAEARDASVATWIETFFDDGGGDAWMVTYSAPITRGPAPDVSAARGGTIDTTARRQRRTQREFLGVVTVDVPNASFNRLDKWLEKTNLHSQAYVFVSSAKQFIKPPPGRQLTPPPGGERRGQDNSEFEGLLELASQIERGACTAFDPLSGRNAELHIASVPFTGWKVVLVVPQ